MDVLKKYRLFCNSENCFVETWKRAKPDLCPNNNRHIIDNSQTILLEQKFIELEKIQHVYISSKAIYQTNDFYMTEGIYFDIPAGVGTSTFNYFIPVKSCVYGFKLAVTSNHVGDECSAIFNPETIVGGVTRPISIGDTTINVSETVTQYVVPGFSIVIDGEEHYVTDTNITAGTLTVRETFTAHHNPGTYVRINPYIIKTYQMALVGMQDIGYGKMGGKMMIAGDCIRILYKNNNGVAKRLSVNMEYTY